MIFLYVVFSIVSGIVTAARKRSQTTRTGGKPVLVPQRPIAPSGEPVPPLVIGGYKEVEVPSGQGLEIHSESAPDQTISFEGTQEIEDDVTAAWAGKSLQEEERGTGLSTSDDEVARLPSVQAASAVRRLVGDLDRLRTVVVAIEVLGKPRSLRPWTCEQRFDRTPRLVW